MSSQILAVLVVTFLVLGLVGLFAIYLGFKNRGSEDWSVGGRRLPWYVVVGTQFATGQGGGMLVASVGIAYAFGWSAMTYGFLSGAGFLVLLIIAKWLRRNEFTTLPDVLKKLYGDNKILISLTIILAAILPIGWLGANMVAFSALFTQLTGLPTVALMIIFAVATLIFVLPAGLLSVAWTDTIFGIMMIVGTIFVAFFTYNMTGGWNEIVSNVPQESVGIPEGFGAAGATTILVWLLTQSTNTITNQMYFQRIYSIDKVKRVNLSVILIFVLAILTSLWSAFMGIAIHSLNPSLDNSENAMGWLLTQLPTWFIAIFAALIISTIISTASSCVQSAVVNVTEDIYKSYINKKASGQKIKQLSRLWSIILLLVVIILASSFPNALDWIITSAAYVTAGLFFPILMGYFFKNTNILTSQGALASMIFGILGTALAQIIGVEVYPIFGLSFSLVALFVFSLLSKERLKMS
ncbi:sodium:solute symporter family protein [Oceanobacillus jeddahense]|uniref:sodium:solute symporter family protein n=1 Tax=Oceanobacillus jeddahense TaxID=1462527 RepID=UPI00363C58CD